MNKPVLREERKVINEPCYWSSESIPGVHNGVIVNESGTGVLLESSDTLPVGDRIAVASIPENDSASSLSESELYEHPLCRWGSVVRLDQENRAGIQLDDDQSKVEFRRWYRGSTIIVSLFFKQKGMVTVQGDLTLDAGGLLQSLLTKSGSKSKELLIALQQCNQIAPTSYSILKMSLKKVLDAGCITTVVYSESHSKSAQLCNEIQSPNFIHVCMEDNCYIENYNTVDESHETSIAERSSTSNEDMMFIVVSRRMAVQSRLSVPITSKGVSFVSVFTFHDAISKTYEYQPSFIVLDVELEEMNQLPVLNQIKSAGLRRLPQLIILGPRLLDELVKAALSLPVKTYISKPYSEREYITAIELLFLHPDS